MIWLLITLVWVVCGYLAYGYTYGYLQRECPRMAEECRPKDRRFSLRMSLLGPIGLLTVFRNGGFKHGRLYRDD